MAKARKTLNKKSLPKNILTPRGTTVHHSEVLDGAQTMGKPAPENNPHLLSLILFLQEAPGAGLIFTVSPLCFQTPQKEHCWNKERAAGVLRKRLKTQNDEAGHRSLLSHTKGEIKAMGKNKKFQQTHKELFINSYLSIIVIATVRYFY